MKDPKRHDAPQIPPLHPVLSSQTSRFESKPLASGFAGPPYSLLARQENP